MRSATHAALFDELAKIAEAGSSGQRSEKLKQWLKNTAIVATGAGAGTAATMVADKYLSEKLGPAWQQANPKMKKWIVGPLLGLAVVGAGLSAQKMAKERMKTEHE